MTVLCWQLLGADRSYCLLQPDDCHWNNPCFQCLDLAQPQGRQCWTFWFLERNSSSNRYFERWFPWFSMDNSDILHPDLGGRIGTYILWDYFLKMRFKGPERPLLFWMFYFEKMSKASQTKDLYMSSSDFFDVSHGASQDFFFKLKTEHTRVKRQKWIQMHRQEASNIITSPFCQAYQQNPSDTHDWSHPPTMLALPVLPPPTKRSANETPTALSQDVSRITDRAFGGSQRVPLSAYQ